MKMDDVKFSILCLNCDKRFDYHPVTEESKNGVIKQEDNFIGVPCPYCDMVWEIYSRVKSMESFEIENILIKPWSMRCGTEQ